MAGSMQSICSLICFNVIKSRPSGCGCGCSHDDWKQLKFYSTYHDGKTSDDLSHHDGKTWGDNMSYHDGETWGGECENVDSLQQ